MVGFLSLFANADAGLESTISSLGLRTVGSAALALIILLIISSQVKDKYPKLKLPLFVTIATIIGGSTLFLFASTVYLNVVSDSGGPVHWHANIEYWACDTEIELRDPYEFLSNKVGSSTLHEHDDKWIHLEGVVVDLDEDATIGNFMRTIGGSLDDTRMVIPINSDQLIEDDTDGDQPSTEHIQQLESYTMPSEDGGRLLELANGQTCGDTPAEVQVFTYQYNEDNDTYQQFKVEAGATLKQQVKAGKEYAPKTLSSLAEYIYADTGQLPPGDCIIFEFDQPKPYTDRLCEQYGLKDDKRCTEFGVSQYDPGLCDITDVTDYNGLDATFNAQGVL